MNKILIFFLLVSNFLLGQSADSTKNERIQISPNIVIFNQVNEGGFNTNHTFFNDKQNITERVNITNKPMFAASIGLKYKGLFQTVSYSHFSTGSKPMLGGDFAVKRDGFRLNYWGYEIGYHFLWKKNSSLKPIALLNFAYLNKKHIGSNYTPGEYYLNPTLFERSKEFVFQVPVGLVFNYKNITGSIKYHIPIYSYSQGDYTYDTRKESTTYKEKYSTNSRNNNYEKINNTYSLSIGYNFNVSEKVVKALKLDQPKHTNDNVDSTKKSKLVFIPNLQFTNHKNDGYVYSENYFSSGLDQFINKKFVLNSIADPALYLSLGVKTKDVFLSANLSHSSSRSAPDSHGAVDKRILNYVAIQGGYDFLKNRDFVIKPVLLLNVAYSYIKYQENSLSIWGGGNSSEWHLNDNTNVISLQLPMGLHINTDNLFIGATYMLPLYAWINGSYSGTSVIKNSGIEPYTDLSNGAYSNRINTKDLFKNSPVINISVGFKINNKSKKERSKNKIINPFFKRNR